MGQSSFSPEIDRGGPTYRLSDDPFHVRLISSKPFAVCRISVLLLAAGKRVPEMAGEVFLE